ncbi:hypothetical protein KV557_40600 [Kitasatospora aureofaciens]|uniref:hypothetical protein n=1 Tax=Kitasatospora aureofaciens TaxID=1894 RepID=UPI001C486E3F|nr:hypothetical protein [Kitasatospora aureofaciens]MBV6703316.1 hypothetical protein [Kitasatospora aureofaciens]
MTGIEIAVGYAFAWLVRKAKRVAGRADAEVDRTLDAAMDGLHDLIGAKLGEEPALRRLAEEAEAGLDQASDRTRQWVTLALEDAAERDPSFGEALKRAVEQVQSLNSASRAPGGVVAGDRGVAVGGIMHVHADRGGVAAGQIAGDVTVGNPPAPGTPQG